MGDEKPLEKLIEETIGEPISLKTLHKLFDQPYLYSADDFMKIITADPFEFENMLRRLAPRDTASDVDFDIGVDLFDFSTDFGDIRQDAFARTDFSKYFNIALYYSLVCLHDEDLEKVIKTGETIWILDWDAAEGYYAALPDILNSKIDFGMWVKTGKSITIIDGDAGNDYFRYSKDALDAKIDFFKWAKAGKELTKINKYAGHEYFKNFKEVLRSGVDINTWLDVGIEVIEKNKEAGIGFFAESVSCAKAKKLDYFLSLFNQHQNPEDFDFLRYRFKFNNSGLNELSALEYLLNNPKQKELVLPESIEHNIFYTEDLGKEVEEIGRKLFRKFYFAVMNRNNTYAENYKDSEFKEVFDAIRGYSFQGKNLRKELSKIFKEHIGSKDIPDVETRTFQKVMDDIDKIEIKKVKHSISDFFNHLSSYLNGINPFTKIKMHAHKRFADELIDNRTLDSCTFGPTGSKREACLGYSADPNIEMIFLSTYLHDKFIDNIGVAYLVNTKENVWLLDGIDAGPTAKNLPGLDWKEVFYDGLLNLIKNSENPPDKVVMNVNLGPKKTPNEFLEYVCKRNNLKYKKERTRIKVDESVKIKTVLNKPLLSESNPEAYEALNTDKAYLEAWYGCAGSPWNTGRGEVEVIELLDFRK